MPYAGKARAALGAFSTTPLHFAAIRRCFRRGLGSRLYVYSSASHPLTCRFLRSVPDRLRERGLVARPHSRCAERSAGHFAGANNHSARPRRDWGAAMAVRLECVGGQMMRALARPWEEHTSARANALQHAAERRRVQERSDGVHQREERKIGYRKKKRFTASGSVLIQVIVYCHGPIEACHSKANRRFMAKYNRQPRLTA